MKALVMMMVIVLSGCTVDELSQRGFSQPLTYKCDIDPYNYECMNPPPVFTN